MLFWQLLGQQAVSSEGVKQPGIQSSESHHGLEILQISVRALFVMSTGLQKKLMQANS